MNQHLGEASRMLIYAEKDGRISLVETRPAPEPGGGNQRWSDLAAILSDCRAVLVHGVGDTPLTILGAKGVNLVVCEGLIEEAVRAGLCRKRSSTHDGPPPAVVQRRVQRESDGMRIKEQQAN